MSCLVQVHARSGEDRREFLGKGVYFCAFCRGKLVLVDDVKIIASIKTYVHATRTLVEHAGAASLAAAIDMKEKIQGKRVVLIASGGNITTDQLKSVLS